MRGFLRVAMGAGAAVAVLAAASALAKEASTPPTPDKAGFIPLFNGENLEGWKAEGKAEWTVKDGCLVGRQGPGNAPGDLFTEEEYGDFDLKATYKIQWPANSGIWFRYQAPDKAYQADILEYKNPLAYSGTVYCPGKMFLSINKNPELEKKDGWNTMEIHAQGDHLRVKLNGVVVGDVHEDSFASGRIGFQVHPGDVFKDMQITVRDIRLRPLGS